MSKKQQEESKDSDNKPSAGGAARPARSRNRSRKDAAHSSTKRKRAKGASRKGSITGGIHQRGDKRVVR